MKQVHHIGLANAIALELAAMLKNAPTDAMLPIVKRSGDWAELARGLASEVKPDDSAKASEEIRSEVGATSSTWSHAKPAEVYRVTLSGELIGMPAGFEEHVKTAKEIRLIFSNALGGDCQTALQMIELLRARGVPVQGHVVDLCGSAHANLFVLGCTSRVMSRTAKLMIHDCRVILNATASELLRKAKEVQAWNERFATAFAERTGQPLEVCRHWFAGEDFWFNSAEKAIAAGLADTEVAE